MVLFAGQHAGLWADNGRMFTLVLTLQHAMPTAVNVHSVAAMHGNHEKVIATLLFWQYIACIITVPVSVTVFLSQMTSMTS
jgi:predicted permease